MPAPRTGSARGRWISVSELAEYTYCPRSWWYGRHPPEGHDDPDRQVRLDAGTRFHEASLGATGRRDAWAGVLPWAAVISAGLLVLAIVLALEGS
ncbi:MAG TPA: hypothetical protein VFG07_00575 [Thermoplasmata archaeon]|nr:hypothetical protein [Thermoplasmata archaeon]